MQSSFMNSYQLVKYIIIIKEFFIQEPNFMINFKFTNQLIIIIKLQSHYFTQ